MDPRVRGRDVTRFIRTLLLDRALCIRCIAAKAAVSTAAAQAALHELEQTFTVSRVTAGQCRACGRVEEVVAINMRGD